jgi:hypothetical protein
VDPLSVSTLLLKVALDDKILCRATGFMVEHVGEPYLITNRHVVKWVDEETGSLANEVHISYHDANHGLYDSILRKEPLYDPLSSPRWVEHPMNESFDIVALPLQTVDQDILFQPFDLSLAKTDIEAFPAQPVSIIGYPLGFSVKGGWPIWKTGHIATDPELDYNKQPVFLIDATTRSGMSGSPVVLRQSGGYNTRGGGLIISPGVYSRFMGVYSGRIHNDSEIGIVWRPEVLFDILNSIPNKS